MPPKERPEPRRGPVRHMGPDDATDYFPVFIKNLVVVARLAGEIGGLEDQHVAANMRWFLQNTARNVSRAALLNQRRNIIDNLPARVYGYLRVVDLITADPPKSK